MKPPRLLRPGAVLATLAALLPAPGHARNQICRFDYELKPKVEIAIEGVFSQAPAWGYLPLFVTIINESDRSRTWRLRFRSVDNFYQEKLSVTSEFRLESAARAEVTHQILLPLASVLDDTFSQEVRVDIISNGLPRRNHDWTGNFSRDWPAIGISDTLARKSLSALDDKVKNTITPDYANEHFGLQYDSAGLPGDWRGLIGLDALMMTEREWLDLPPPARLAVLQWNRLGGHLDIYASGNTTTLESLGFSGNATAKRSLGEVQLHSWNGTDLDTEKTFAAFRSLPKSARELVDGYSTGWGLPEAFGDESFNGTFVLIVLLLFGILVGPVNFWVLAPPGRRHRLFVTTPVLSVGASLIMAVMILVSDGTGGSGMRFTVLNLEPDPAERRAYLIQEQFARTGLILGRTFTLESDSALSPVNLLSSPWSQFNASGSRRNDLTIQGRDYGGDWFRSRSQTAHALRTVRSTRARIEYRGEQAGGSPALFSSLGFDVTNLFYIDATGAVWKSAAPLTTGSTPILEPSTETELNAWWKKQRQPASKALRAELDALTSQRGLFFATSTDPRVNPVATGDFIDWEDNPVPIYGTLLDASSPPAAP